MNATSSVTAPRHDRIDLLLRRLSEITQEARVIKDELATQFYMRQQRMESIKAAHARYYAQSR